MFLDTHDIYIYTCIHIYIQDETYIHYILYTVLYVRVCVQIYGLTEARLVSATGVIKSGPSDPFNSSCLLFCGPKNRAAIACKKQKPPKLRPHFWDQSVAYTVSPPCVQRVAETLEPFIHFPCDGIDKAISKFHIEDPPSRKHSGPGGSAV